MNRKYLFCLSLFITLLTSNSMAQLMSVFDQWDKDKNGKLSREELPAGLRQNFDRVDSNKDGWISREEDTQIRSQQVRNRRVVLPKGVKKTSNIDYAGTDNSRQKLDLYHPEGIATDTKLPLVCWFHGGGWATGDKTYVGKIIPFLTSNEYICASVGFRLSSESQWPSQIHDCKAAIRFLKANADQYNIDADRIVAVGSSSGGHLAAMIGLTTDNKSLEGTIGNHLDENAKVNCVVNFYGPSDLVELSDRFKLFNLESITNPTTALIGGPLSSHRALTEYASPIRNVSKNAQPILLIHGTSDPFIPYQQNVDLKAALEKAGVESQFITVTNGGHGQNFPYVQLNKSMKAFVDYHLHKRGTKPVDITLEAAK